MNDITISLTLNGARHECVVPSHMVLLDLLRDRFGLRGCKPGCDQAVCGACTVLIDGLPLAPCARLAASVDGCDILTIEGLEAQGEDGKMHPVQKAFAISYAVQCGYCTAGMVMMTVALLARDPAPSEHTIRSWLGGHLCRCTGYQQIIEAIQLAAQFNAR